MRQFILLSHSPLPFLTFTLLASCYAFSPFRFLFSYFPLTYLSLICCLHIPFFPYIPFILISSFCVLPLSPLPNLLPAIFSHFSIFSFLTFPSLSFFLIPCPYFAFFLFSFCAFLSPSPLSSLPLPYLFPVTFFHLSNLSFLPFPTLSFL